MWIMVREGTTARNLKDLLPLVTPENSRRFLFVTDDRHPKELLEEGHIDSMVRKAIQWGTDPVLAIQMATLNAAEYFRLEGLGAIAPGYRADIVVFDHSARFQIKKVFKDGLLVAENGKMVRLSVLRSLIILRSLQEIPGIGTLRIKPLSLEALVLRGDNPMAKVIQLIPDQIITKKVVRKILLKRWNCSSGCERGYPQNGRDRAASGTGNIGIGFVQGFGLKNGAIGSTVAHDSHNLVIVGTNDQDILKTMRRLNRWEEEWPSFREGRSWPPFPFPLPA